MPDLRTDYVAHDPEDSVHAVNAITLEVNSLRARVTELELLGGGGGSGGGFSNALIIASSQSSAADKARAHYVCDGAADEVEIIAAIKKASVLAANAKTDNTGAAGDLSSHSDPTGVQCGKVILMGGNFFIGSAILMRTGVWVQGSGFLTSLWAKANNGTAVFRLNPQAGLAGDGSAAHLTYVSNLWVYGNYGSGGTCSAFNYNMSNSGDDPYKTKGYPAINPDAYHYIVDVLITGFAGANRDGVNLNSAGTANHRANILRGLQIRDCGRDGISFSAASDSYISECHIGGSGRYNYNIATGNTKITACKSFYSNVAGFYFGSGRGTVTALEAQDDKIGYFFDGTPYTATGLTGDSCEVNFKVDTDRLVMTSFSGFNRGSARYPTTLTSLLFDATYADMMILGQVDDANTTTKISGTVGSRSFMRVSDGTTLVSVGA